MNSQALDHPFATPPLPAQAVEIAAGIHWIRMPLPFALNHINLWLLEDDEGWAIVDTGLNLRETRSHWATLLDGGMLADSVSRILVTHYHPDHSGLAGWLHERTGAEVTMTQIEWLTANFHFNDLEAVNNLNMVAFFARHGLDEERQQSLRALGNRFRQGVSQPPAAYRAMRNGDRLRVGGREWRVIVGRGHAPEHACLYCAEAKVLISGDQILPSITPNIMLTSTQPFANPLDDYLNSFDAFADLPGDVLVLPSHGLPFIGLHERIASLRAHHRERLAWLCEQLTHPQSATDLLPTMFRRELDTHQLMFAMGECLAHLAYLRAAGDARELERDGIRCFQQTAQGMAA